MTVCSNIRMNEGRKNGPDMNDWHDYPDDADSGDHTVVGTLKVMRDFYSPQLGNRRDIWVQPTTFLRSHRTAISGALYA